MSKRKAKSQKPKAKSQKPKAKSQKPKAKSQKPKAKSQKPKAKSPNPKPNKSGLQSVYTLYFVQNPLLAEKYKRSVPSIYYARKWYSPANWLK
ncbi:hypothetical protein PV433_19340 [Paenibacillus sp. GYB004]|uniref:hypothetical protein n=1 Tax=Paenibacillus sp. GYB004 TaxID=2994393 RepID=UPI002F9674D2